MEASVSSYIRWCAYPYVSFEVGFTDSYDVGFFYCVVNYGSQSVYFVVDSIDVEVPYRESVVVSHFDLSLSFFQLAVF